MQSEDPSDYKYFLPGYTGFCPLRYERFDRRYSWVTKEVIKEHPMVGSRLAPIRAEARRPQSSAQQTNRDDSVESSHFNHHRRDYPELLGVVSEYAAYSPTDRRNIYDEERFHRSLRVPQDSGPNCTSSSFAHSQQPVLNGSVAKARTVPINQCTSHYLCTCPECTERWFRRCAYETVRVPIHEEVSNSRGHEDSTSAGYTEAQEASVFDCASNQGPVTSPCNYRRFHREGGTIPNYAGHIPGSKFAFAERFGKISGKILGYPGYTT